MVALDMIPPVSRFIAVNVVPLVARSEAAFRSSRVLGNEVVAELRPMPVTKDAVVRDFAVNNQIGGIPIERGTATQSRMKKSVWCNDSMAWISIFFGGRIATLGDWLPGQFDGEILRWSSAGVLKHNADFSRRFCFIAWRDLADRYPRPLIQLAVPVGLLVGIASSAPESYSGRGVDSKHKYANRFSPKLKILFPVFSLCFSGDLILYGWWNLGRGPCNCWGGLSLICGIAGSMASHLWLLQTVKGC